MPSEEQLTVSVNRKVQLDQFEPIQFGATLDVTLEEGDDKEEVYEEKAAELAGMVDKEIVRRAVDVKRMDENGDD